MLGFTSMLGSRLCLMVHPYTCSAELDAFDQICWPAVRVARLYAANAAERSIHSYHTVIVNVWPFSTVLLDLKIIFFLVSLPTFLGSP